MITTLIESKLAETIMGLDAMDPQAAWRAMQLAVRNLGREGLAATAISAVDTALYDLKARILGVPLATMLGTYRNAIPIYGSGGFTTYSDDELKSQLGRWVSLDGCAFVKMKVGTDPDDDPRRTRRVKRIDHTNADQRFQVGIIDGFGFLKTGPSLSEPVRARSFIHPCHALEI